MERYRKVLPYLIFLTIAFASSAWVTGVMKRNEIPSADKHFPWKHIDLVPVWMGTQAILHHENPYSPEYTATIQRTYFGRPLTAKEAKTINAMGFAYPANLAVFLAPLSLLSWQALSLIGFSVMLVATAASGTLWLRLLELELPAPRRLLLSSAIFVSWPAVWGMRGENITLLLVPLIALGCLCLKQKRSIAAGILLAAATTKPQLVFLLIPWLLFRSALERNWRFLIAFSATAALSCGIASALLPHWLRLWREGLREYSRYNHLHLELPVPFLIALGVLTIAVLWKVRSAPLGIGVSLALAAGYAISPFTQPTSYNLLVLSPAILYLIAAQHGYSSVFRNKNVHYVLLLGLCLFPILSGVVRTLLLMPVLTTLGMMAAVRVMPQMQSVGIASLATGAPMDTRTERRAG
jgi:Glycosyltransferase family 87